MLETDSGLAVAGGIALALICIASQMILVQIFSMSWFFNLSNILSIISLVAPGLIFGCLEVDACSVHTYVSGKWHISKCHSSFSKDLGYVMKRIGEFYGGD